MVEKVILRITIKEGSNMDTSESMDVIQERFVGV